MEHTSMGTISVIGIAVTAALFWYDYRTSGCGYGGSRTGHDNWALRILRKHVSAIKRLVAQFHNRRARSASAERSEFQDVFGI